MVLMKALLPDSNAASGETRGETRGESRGETRARGRPRSAVAHRAILDAAIEILAEGGIESVTVEGIAARARVAKTTIYRRWPNKELLLVEAVSSVVRGEEALPDHGNIRDDLLDLARSVRTRYADGPLGRILPALLSSQLRRPEFAAVVREQIIEPRRAFVLGIVERAVERGELRSDVDSELVFDMVIAPVFYGAVVLGRLPDERALVHMVDLVLDGCRT